ncbi:flagellar biosynthesis anti-sigma factor FlgM [Paucisalibacillus globulus]|jgi:negative regulator of flagellin synthesis FlgM|uniref:flagellar biosynthesis anti-sigma factor FlgM n=1 Tax=Paucisalibacillus globulus TaxID=351095 RepID=UPI000BB90822|nr:flagellar biosynthesis anti-sigma factor FlgM [Paucisalibacillus globulus]
MKVNGPNQTNFNPYKNQIQKQMEMKKVGKQQDQLEISSEAMKLQENTKVNAKREAYVQEIKNRVESGQYEINYEKTAQKMIDFWSKQ